MNTSSRTMKLALLADTAQFSRGLKGAVKQTTSFGDKVKGIAKSIGLAFAGATVAVAGFAVKLGIDAVKAAIADQKSQVILAKTLQNTTKATKTQTAAVEKYITKLSLATGVADDKLRPSLSKLLTATGSITKAQKLQALALDISAGTGKDLETVSLALAKAYGGNLGSLTKLGVKLDAGTIKSKDFDAAAKELNKTFGGQSAAAAETMQGRMERMTVAFDEAKESIGYALLPTFTTFVDWLTKDGIPGLQTFIDVMSGGTGKTLNQAILGGKKDMDGFTYGAMSENQDAWIGLADSVKGMGTAFGKLFEKLEIDNPEGGFNSFVNGLASAADAMGFIADKVGYFAKNPLAATGPFGMIASFFGNRVGDLFGGGKATGGHVRSGMSYLVGERGPEMFTPSGGGGNITPNHKMGSTYITVNSLDAAGAARAVIAAQNKAKRMGVSKLAGAAS